MKVSKHRDISVNKKETLYSTQKDIYVLLIQLYNIVHFFLGPLSPWVLLLIVSKVQTATEALFPHPLWRGWEVRDGL